MFKFVKQNWELDLKNTFVRQKKSCQLSHQEIRLAHHLFNICINWVLLIKDCIISTFQYNHTHTHTHTHLSSSPAPQTRWSIVTTHSHNSSQLDNSSREAKVCGVSFCSSLLLFPALMNLLFVFCCWRRVQPWMRAEICSGLWLVLWLRQRPS